MEFRLEFGLSHGRSRRRVHREEADDELRPRGRDPLQRRLARGRREGARPFDFPCGRRRRDCARPFHSRCRRERRADRDRETDGGGRPPHEREQHRDRVVEVRSGSRKTFIGTVSSRPPCRRSRSFSCWLSRRSSRDWAAPTWGLAAEPALVKRLNLSSVYFDQEDQAVYRYRVDRPGAGFGVSAAAGLFSGLLGVGGGFIKVPAMNILMRVPMKAAVATSNFMIGVTAAASAFIYYSQGLVDPSLAAMVIIGVFTGTNLGTRLLVRAKAATVRFVFAFFLAALGIAMAARALGLSGAV